MRSRRAGDIRPATFTSSSALVLANRPFGKTVTFRATSPLLVSRWIVCWTPSSIDRLAASTNAPKTTPRVVRQVRIFCWRSDARGNRSRSSQRTRRSSLRSRSDAPGRESAVDQPDDPVGAGRRQLLVVGDEDEGGGVLADV